MEKQTSLHFQSINPTQISQKTGERSGVPSLQEKHTRSNRAATGTCKEDDKRLVQGKCAVRVKHTDFKGVAPLHASSPRKYVKWVKCS